ncbi:hypothetical protein [Granulicella sp. L46]|uniref:hypothetical protein n=1 Tax=Granulicella sp. L46 TaxID=1641865 RepID=UPI00131B9454|nr:hypothetical protein [Granulicella sp. L46]
MPQTRVMDGAPGFAWGDEVWGGGVEGVSDAEEDNSVVARAGALGPSAERYPTHDAKDAS